MKYRVTIITIHTPYSYLNHNHRCSYAYKLTNNSKLEHQWHLGLSRYLAFISSWIFNSSWRYFENPFVSITTGMRCKSPVSGVCVRVHCQNLHISLTNPWHLEMENGSFVHLAEREIFRLMFVVSLWDHGNLHIRHMRQNCIFHSKTNVLKNYLQKMRL